MKNIRIIALTNAGRRLGENLSRNLPGSELWFKPLPFAEKVQRAFRAAEPLIFICATGIVVRTLAPVIGSKQSDPPVLVLDEAGRFVIPLLSGHEGGANQWAAVVADLLQAQLVMTTANPYLIPVYTVGMGCERGCPKDELEKLLRACLLKAGITLEQIESINSIDIKSDERGLIELAQSLDKPFQTFDRETLSKVENLLSTKSEYVFKTVGVYGVAESAALVAASQATSSDAELILNKEKTSVATCSIARAYSG